MLLGAISLQAQSLAGSWVTILEEGGNNIAVLFGFDEADNTIVKTIYEIHDKGMGTVNLELTAEGKYKVNGKKLMLHLDKNKTEVGIGDVEWTDQMKAKFKQDPNLEKTIRQTLKNKFEEQKDAFTEELFTDEEMTIISLTSTALVLKSEDDTMTFKRFNTQ